MNEKRRPTFTFLLRPQGDIYSIRVELFDASQWKEKLNGRQTDGLYRIRVNDSWFYPDIRVKDKYFLCDYMTAMAHLAKTILKIDPHYSPCTMPEERLYTGNRPVRVKLKDGSIMRTSTMGIPFQDPSGAWRIFVVGGSQCAHNPAYVDELEIIKG